MSLSTKLDVHLKVRRDNTLDLGGSAASEVLDLALTLADGVNAGQANRAWTDTRQLAASATEDLDLAGALADPFGVAQVLARVKLLVVRAAAGNTNSVVVSRPAANGWSTFFQAASDAVALRPGAWLVLAAGAADATGYAVTATTGDLITVTNGGAGTAVDYSIAVVGCST